MSTDERLDRLERRVAVLEQLLREQTQRGVAASRAPVEAATAGGDAGQLRCRKSPQPPRRHHPYRRGWAPPQAHRPRRAPQPMRAPAAAQSSVLDEKWIGQRGFLAVGVVALLLATGYLLKLSFERGWISPVMRCTGGALLGVVVGAIGWRLYERYRVYGASLIGSGCGIIYLSVWAACRLYEVIPPTTGIVGLALVSVALAMIAYAINMQALGTIAALGAFMAPVLLGRDDANANHVLMLYLASMAAGLGLVAARRGWRLTMFVVAASYFGSGRGRRRSAEPMALLVYGVIGGTAGLYVGLQRAVVGDAVAHLLRRLGHRRRRRATAWRPHWPVFVCGADSVGAGVVARAPASVARSRPDSAKATTAGCRPARRCTFFITPLLLAWATYGLAPDRFDADARTAAGADRDSRTCRRLSPAPPAFRDHRFRRDPDRGGIPVGGLTEVWALLGLALLWPALTARSTGLTDVGTGSSVWVAAINSCFQRPAGAHAADDAAFVGPWALALWAVTAVAVALASGLLKAKPEEGEAQLARQALWVVSGLLVFFGVTAEIRRYFELQDAVVGDGGARRRASR